MQRYMRSMSNGGVVMAQPGETLDDDTLRRYVPSIFATEAHESRSTRFVPIPTGVILGGLRREGFEPTYAQQSRTRIEGKQEFTKHMIRMRHRSLQRGEGEAFEVILLNANDGTCAYKLMPGFFRFVCANGLFVGDTFEPVHVRHSGSALDDVIEGTCRVLDEAPRLIDGVERMRGTPLSVAEARAMAEAAHILRFPKAYQPEGDEDDPATEMKGQAPITPEHMLTPRRPQDIEGNRNLWSTFNVLQENAIKGGQAGSIRGANGRRRRQTTREVRGIDQQTALNRALWTLAERMAELKAT